MSYNSLLGAVSLHDMGIQGPPLLHIFNSHCCTVGCIENIRRNYSWELGKLKSFSPHKLKVIISFYAVSVDELCTFG